MAIISPVEMAYLDWLVSSVEAEQKNILESRNYYNGAQAEFLTALVQDFLGLHEDNPFTLNVCESIWPIICVCHSARLNSWLCNCADSARWASLDRRIIGSIAWLRISRGCTCRPVGR